MAGRTVRRFVADLGYVVHTPASVFTRARLDDGLNDADWLPIVGREGWAVFGRDQRILDREIELRAYLDARVDMFLLPGQARRDDILHLLQVTLRDICAVAVARRPDVYWVTTHGLVPYERRRADRDRRRRRQH